MFRSLTTTRLRVAAMCVGILFAAGAARADRLKIVVGGADFRAFPVAAPGIILEGAATDALKALRRELTQTLQGGIAFVRVLELVPPKSYLAAKDESWTAPIYAGWVNVGASGLIRGHAVIKGEEIVLGMRFYDVLAQRQLLARKYSVKPDAARTAIHRFLDEIVEMLTGEPGILSSRLVFTKRTKNGKAVFVSDVDGKAMFRVSDPEQLSLLPAWGRRGKHVLYTSYLKGNPDIYRQAVRREEDGVALQQARPQHRRRRISQRQEDRPDSQCRRQTPRSTSWIGTARTSNASTDNWGQDVSATWSPDGKRIAFVSSRSGQPHIYVMNADGSGPRRLTFQGTYNQEPSWSPRPDGLIAFCARDEQLMYDIFLVHPDSGKITRLTQDEGVRNESPSFSPDGQQIVFTSTRPPGRGKKLYVIDVDGRNPRRISQGSGEFETPEWGPRQPLD